MIKKLMLMSILVASYALQASSFYGIKVWITHNEIYDHNKWQAMSDLVKELVEFSSKGKENSYEDFKAGLEKSGTTLKQLRAIMDNDDSFNVTCSIVKDENLFVRESKGIELGAAFKPSRNEQRIDTLVEDFINRHLDCKAALDELGDLLVAIFSEEFFGIAEGIIKNLND